MRLIIQDTADDVAVWSAKYVKARIIEKCPGPLNYFVLGLPTGGTPKGMYAVLVKMFQAGEISFRYCKSFNMDEYVGLPRDHPESYHSFMWENLFKHIDMHPENVHILDGNAPDLTEECRLYEEKIVKAGGIDLFLGGIGPDGHIAFNEPGSSLVSRTRIKTLNKETIGANARFFGGDISAVPTQALTVGVQTILDAKEVLILITGAHKALALHEAVEGGINHMWTVTALQQHARAVFVCDDDATMELKVKTVKYFKDLMSLHDELTKPDMSLNGRKRQKMEQGS